VVKVEILAGVVHHGAPTFALSRNYPNPFNPSTSIRMSLAAESFVTLGIYDVTGREIRTLVHEQYREGTYEVRWDATGKTGARVASGMYLYRIEARPVSGGMVFTDAKGMWVLK
jgi:hypothetical protein